ncbi:MAG: hypothetical protein H6728_01590 [Myxococcales bacterium]|nr:hypothetical protein [Myxococcales bacterium]
MSSNTKTSATKSRITAKEHLKQRLYQVFHQDQAAMVEPFEIEFDLITNKPLFCKTKDGYYYLFGTGYGECDKDKDGWINIEAYRAVTSTDPQIRNNARCSLKSSNTSCITQKADKFKSKSSITKLRWSKPSATTVVSS